MTHFSSTCVVKVRVWNSPISSRLSSPVGSLCKKDTFFVKYRNRGKMVTQGWWRGCSWICTSRTTLAALAKRVRQLRLITSWTRKDMVDIRIQSTSPISQGSSRNSSQRLNLTKREARTTRLQHQDFLINFSPLSYCRLKASVKMNFWKVLWSGQEVRLSLTMLRKQIQPQMRKFKKWWASWMTMTERMIVFSESLTQSLARSQTQIIKRDKGLPLSTFTMLTNFRPFSSKKLIKSLKATVQAPHSSRPSSLKIQDTAVLQHSKLITH